MTIFDGWTPLITALALAGVLVGALLSLGARPALGWARETLAPRARFWTAWVLALLPIGLATLFVVISFTPSLLHAVGLVADHCADHPGHAFHLCFVHGVAPGGSWALVLAGVALAGLVAFGSVREAVRAARTTRWANRMRSHCRYDDAHGGWLIPGTMAAAFTVGLLRPSVFVSERLRESLSAPQLLAVWAHEQEHARRGHALLKSLARACSVLHLPGTAAALLRELDLAAEQVCDEAAATRVGARLTVAEAIVSVERLGRADLPAGVLPFAVGAVEHRVHALLDARWSTVAGWLLLATGASIVGVTAAHYERVHHFAESALSYLF